jgi:hypothetical protein
MRYTLAVLLALGIGVTAAIPAALATPQSLLSPADAEYVTSPPSLGPGYNTGYGTVVQPSRPLWVVQFPL